MAVALHKSWEDYVAEQVHSGEFATDTDVVEDALRLQQDRKLKLEALRREIQIGMDDIAAGRVVKPTVDEIIAAARLRKQQAK